MTRVSTTNTAFYFVTSSPGTREPQPAWSREAILANINRQLFAQVPEAVAFAFSPPAIPGLGNAGGFSLWLQDRSGGSVDDLDQNLQKFLQAARKRPELVGVNSQFSAQRRRFRHRGSRQSAEAGRAISDVYQTLQASLGGLYVNQFNRFGRQWKSVPRSGSRGSLDHLVHRSILRAQPRRHDGAALNSGLHCDPRMVPTTPTGSISTARRR